MSEIAFTKAGQRFAPSASARWWGVHELLDNRGTKTVYDRGGVPLRIPIGADFTTLHEAYEAVADRPDRPVRLRLTQLDADIAPIPDAPRAYVRIPPLREQDHDDEDATDCMTSPGPCATTLRNAAPPPTVVTTSSGTWPLPMPVALSGEQYLLGEALRAQAQALREQNQAQKEQWREMKELVTATLIAQTSVVHAAADMVRAADGAGISRREPRAEPPPAPTPPPPAPPPPPPPPPPAPPTYYYDEIPRNATFVEGDYEVANDETDVGDDAAPIEPTSEDFFSKAQKLVTTVAQAIGPVADMAKVVMGAGLGGLGGLFGGGGGETPRNAAPTEPEAAPSLGHLYTSHALAVSHELGAKDGSLFRRMIMAMEPDDRAMFIGRLCELPLDEAVRFAAEKVAWMKARLARARRVPTAAAPIDVVANEAADDGDELADERTDDQPANDRDEHDLPDDDDDDDDEPVHAEDTDPNDANTDHPDDTEPTDDHPNPEDPATEHEPTMPTDHLGDPELPDEAELPEYDSDDRADDRDAMAAPGDQPVSVPAPAAPKRPAAPAMRRVAASGVAHPSLERRATPARSTSAAPPPAMATVPTALTTTPAPEAPLPFTPEIAAHMHAIARVLHVREVFQAQQLINGTSVAERNRWIERLMRLSPQDAATAVRDELARRAGAR